MNLDNIFSFFKTSGARPVKKAQVNTVVNCEAVFQFEKLIHQVAQEQRQAVMIDDYSQTLIDYHERVDIQDDCVEEIFGESDHIVCDYVEIDGCSESASKDIIQSLDDEKLVDNDVFFNNALFVEKTISDERKLAEIGAVAYTVADIPCDDSPKTTEMWQSFGDLGALSEENVRRIGIVEFNDVQRNHLLIVMKDQFDVFELDSGPSFIVGNLNFLLDWKRSPYSVLTLTECLVLLQCRGYNRYRLVTMLPYYRRWYRGKVRKRKKMPELVCYVLNRDKEKVITYEHDSRVKRILLLLGGVERNPGPKLVGVAILHTGKVSIMTCNFDVQLENGENDSFVFDTMYLEVLKKYPEMKFVKPSSRRVKFSINAPKGDGRFCITVAGPNVRTSNICYQQDERFETGVFTTHVLPLSVSMKGIPDVIVGCSFTVRIVGKQGYKWQQRKIPLVKQVDPACKECLQTALEALRVGKEAARDGERLAIKMELEGQKIINVAEKKIKEEMAQNAGPIATLLEQAERWLALGKRMVDDGYTIMDVTVENERRIKAQVKGSSKLVSKRAPGKSRAVNRRKRVQKQT